MQINKIRNISRILKLNLQAQHILTHTHTHLHIFTCIFVFTCSLSAYHLAANFEGLRTRLLNGSSTRSENPMGKQPSVSQPAGRIDIFESEFNLWSNALCLLLLLLYLCTFRMHYDNCCCRWADIDTFCF